MCWKDNVVSRSRNIPWYDGPSLLEHLETVEIVRKSEAGFRMPVQRVSREHDSFRGYAGTVASGAVRPGDAVVALPSGLRSRVKSIVTFDGELPEAAAPMAITLELEDHLDISRGDMLFSAASRPPKMAARFEADLIWMDPRALDARKRYLLKHTARTVAAFVQLRHRVNIQTLEPEQATDFPMNSIGVVEIVTAQPLIFDSYTSNHITGSFVLIDPETNITSAAGMIRGASADQQAGPVKPSERIARWGHRGAILEVSTKTVALTLERLLFDRGAAVAVVDSAEAAAVLEAAGMLAILPGSAVGETDISAIVQRLEREGILTGHDVHSQGEGI